MKAMPIGPVDYQAKDPPENYCCGKCGASGQKLWRRYSSSYIELYCLSCAEASQGTKLELFSDQIGWLVPAVPTPGGGAYWGYTSVPDDAVDWWYGLAGLPARMVRT